MRQWNEVEASFAHHYQLSLDDLLNLSWRRFRVLFGAVFSWKDQEEADENEVARISSSVDWSQAQHVPAAELGKGISVNRVPVGKSDSG